MFITVGETNYEIDEMFQDEIWGILERYKAQEAAIQIRHLTRDMIKGLTFYIKNYQRGYRWTKTEIEELLNDINDLQKEETGYCLQPLVVTKITKGVAQCKLGDENEQEYKDLDAYELIDGQQRLTTLWLIGDYLKSKTSLEPYHYEIYYELFRTVDKHYIKKAKDIIANWFESGNESVEKDKDKTKGRKEVEKIDLTKFCANLRKLFFVWYEVKSGVSEELFNSVNDGKVPLTNAELFKALLLDEDSGLDETGLVKIAYEWDKLESYLRDDDFWYFISNDQSDKKTRIDYLLDVYAKGLYDKDKDRDLDFHKERFSFLMAQRYKNNGEGTANKIWIEIVKTYDKLYSWYKNDELYHTIGFLVACEDRNRNSKATASELICDFYKEYKDSPTSEIQKKVRNTIRERYFTYTQDKKARHLNVAQVKYEYPEKDPTVKVDTKWLRAILLFSNIYAGYFQVVEEAKKNNEEPFYQRFPFKTYKSMDWDIEHIKPKALPRLEYEKGSNNDIRSAFEALWQEGDLSEKDKDNLKKYLDDNASDFANDKDFKTWQDKWNDYANWHTADHDLSNLVLLDAKTNRGYHNAFFGKKREDVIRYDIMGRFIPLCTKRAFLKYYAKEGDKDKPYWTNEGKNSDKEGYKQEWTDMFKAIEKWRAQDENGK